MEVSGGGDTEGGVGGGGGLNEYFIFPFPLAACRVEGRREAFLFWGVRVSVSFKDLRASFPLPLCYLPARVLQKAE